MRAVCVFCGASSGRLSAYADAARSLGAALAGRGLALVYGGGRVGMMGAVADGALAAGGEVTGVIPQELVARELAHGGLTRLHVVETLHERKALMADLSDGFIALPGGFGTLDEFFEVVTLVQTERIPRCPLILFGREYWTGLLRWMKTQMQDKNKFISPGDLDLFTITDDPQEAVDIIIGYEHTVSTPEVIPRGFA